MIHNIHTVDTYIHTYIHTVHTYISVHDIHTYNKQCNIKIHIQVDTYWDVIMHEN